MKYFNRFISKKSIILALSEFLFVLAVSVIIVSCSGSENKEFTVVKDVKVEPFNKALAEQGKKIFAEKCASCHKYDTKLVGPPLRDVTKRRSAEYILSQILYPEQMIANNDTIKALLGKYMTSMPNQHLNMVDAKAVFEHLRDVANGGGN